MISLTVELDEAAYQTEFEDLQTPPSLVCALLFPEISEKNQNQNSVHRLR